MEIEIEATIVYQKTLEASKKYKIICEEGGSRSSKTWSIFQFFIVKALAGECFTLTIARSKLTWVKTTLLKDFEAMANLYKLQIIPEINPNRPEQTYFLNGSEFAFFGLDQPQKLHGRKQDYFWLNEVMEIDKKSFDQLEMRTTKQGIIDYNPSNDAHWVFDLQKRPDVALIKSTQLDNPFLDETIRAKILSYDPSNPINVQNGTADQYMWDVYGLGVPAKLEGVIFSNWDIAEEIPEDAKPIGLGLDFGYTNDPTALIDIYMYNNELYLDELIYQTGLLNTSPYPEMDTISKRMSKLEVGYKEITADSAEPKSIAELRNDGWNIQGAKKGGDSVKFGIDLMKGYKIHLTKRSINLQNEFRKYKWSVAPSGKATNIPVDEFNHGIDAARYRITKVLGSKFKTKLYHASVLGQ